MELVISSVSGAFFSFNSPIVASISQQLLWKDLENAFLTFMSF